MAVISNLLSFVFIYLVFLGRHVCSAEECVQKGPCRCVYPNGTGVDLSPSALKQFYPVPFYKIVYKAATIAQYELQTYYFNPCEDVKLNVSVPETCNVPMAFYRQSYTLNKASGAADLGSMFNLSYANCEFLGNTVQSKLFSADSGPVIRFMHGPSNSTILLMCSGGDSQLHTYDMDDPHDQYFAFYSKDACLQQLEEPGRSLGSTLLIIFFSFVIFYLVLGVCTKKFLMGATGVEVIPNLGFWTDLPNLVKDGWAFAIRGFRLPTRGVGPAGPSDPNSYDSI